jgi:hypothetical protein
VGDIVAKWQNSFHANHSKFHWVVNSKSHRFGRIKVKYNEIQIKKNFLLGRKKLETPAVLTCCKTAHLKVQRVFESVSGFHPANVKISANWEGGREVLAWFGDPSESRVPLLLGIHLKKKMAAVKCLSSPLRKNEQFYCSKGDISWRM